jgi:hypothetical protein
MTPEQYMREAEGYYGPYQPVVAKYVRAWFVARALPEATIKELWAETIKSVSSSYRTPPDVKALEDGMRAVKAREDKRPELHRYLPDPPPSTAERELSALFLQHVVGCLTGGRDPRKDNSIKCIMEALDDQVPLTQG